MKMDYELTYEDEEKNKKVLEEREKLAKEKGVII